MKVHASHTLYTEKDFTEEEIARDNRLAVWVIDCGLCICKVCGGAEAELDNSCQYNQQARRWERLDYMEALDESK